MSSFAIARKTGVSACLGNRKYDLSLQSILGTDTCGRITVLTKFGCARTRWRLTEGKARLSAGDMKQELNSKHRDVMTTMALQDSKKRPGATMTLFCW